LVAANATPEERRRAVVYVDGKNDNWHSAPAITSCCEHPAQPVWSQVKQLLAQAPSDI
jgi:hypothetical protein